MKQNYNGKEVERKVAREQFLEMRDFIVASFFWMFTWKDKNAERLKELYQEHQNELHKSEMDASSLLDTTKRELQEHKEVIVGLKETISSQDSSLSEKTEALADATGRISILTGHLHSVAESFGIDVGEGLERLGEVSTEFSDVVEKIKACSTALNESISSLNGTITEHEATIKTLYEEASVDSETIATLKDQLSEAQETIKALGVREESVEVQALKAQNKKLTDELESSTKTVEECQRAIKRYQKQVEVLRTALTSKKSHDEKISGNGMNI